MNRIAISKNARLVVLVLALALLTAPANAMDWQDHAPLPAPIANNAVTTHVLAGTTFVYTFFGIDSTKIWSGITTEAKRLNTTTNVWETLPDVPVSIGVIAASAVTLGDSIYVIGGYRVSSTGAETTRRQVWGLNPATATWFTDTAQVPIRVDDMVAGTWNDTHIFLVSGWSQTANVRAVQVYERATNSWTTAPSIPDFGTFGGIGGVCGDHIVFMDGASDVGFGFTQSNRVLVGTINPADPTDVTWEDRGPHPGPGIYRGASWNLPGDDTRIIVAGGTDNPYNFDGLGYDGNPSEPLGNVWSYHVPTGTMVSHADKPTPTMDHRGFPAGGDGRMYIVGGMEAGQMVTARVSSWFPDPVTAVPVSQSALSRLEIQAVPNPARTGVRFSASFDEVLLRDSKIYDTAGRVVRTLEEGSAREVVWDLQNEAGRRVGAGVYFFFSRSGERTVARAVTVLDQ